MLHEKEKQIDGFNVRVKAFPGVQAIRLKAKLMKQFLPTIATFVGGIDSKSIGNAIENSNANHDSVFDNDISMDVFTSAAEKLVANISEEGLVSLLGEMFEYTYVENENQEYKNLATNKKLNSLLIDELFVGRLLSLYKIAFFVLEVNYPDFFGLGQSLVGQSIQQTDITKPEKRMRLFKK